MRSSIVKDINHKTTPQEKKKTLRPVCKFRDAYTSSLKSVFVFWGHGGHITCPDLKMKLTGSDSVHLLIAEVQWRVERWTGQEILK